MTSVNFMQNVLSAQDNKKNINLSLLTEWKRFSDRILTYPRSLACVRKLVSRYLPFVHQFLYLHLRWPRQLQSLVQVTSSVHCSHWVLQRGLFWVKWECAIYLCSLSTKALLFKSLKTCRHRRHRSVSGSPLESSFRHYHCRYQDPSKYSARHWYPYHTVFRSVKKV